MPINMMPYLSRLGKILIGNETPKWLYPLFGAAAAAPVVGYAVRKHKPPPKPDAPPDEELIAKAGEAIDLALGKTATGDDVGQGINIEPTPQELAKQRLTNVQTLTGMVGSARRRAHQANRASSPTLQAKGDYPQDSDPHETNQESIRPEFRSSKS